MPTNQGPRVEYTAAACDCPQRDGMTYHQRGACSDPIVARLDWYADVQPTDPKNCEGCDRLFVEGQTCPACGKATTCLRCGWCCCCAGFIATAQGTGPRDCPCQENQSYGTCGH